MSRNPRPSRRRRPLSLLLTAVLLAAVLPAAAAGAVDIQPRVFGGEDATIEELPSMAFIYNATEQGACTGTVIAPRWVLTAAHCFADLDDEVYVLLNRAGITEISLNDFVETDRVVVHPDWDLDTELPTWADIALVQLAAATTVPAQPLAPAGSPHPIGADAVIAGWGQVGPNQEAETLQRGSVPVIEGANCAQAYGFAAFRDEIQLCAGGGVMDTCQGDSGGPLMVESDGVLVQYGLTAFGPNVACGNQDGVPAVYTSVAFYRPWIEEVTGIASEAVPEEPPAPDPEPEPEPEPAPEPEPEPDPEPLPLPDPDPDPLPGPPPASALFDDVADDDAHAAGIAWVAAAEITMGTGSGQFAPSETVTRAQMSSFLVRASEDLEPSSSPPPFSDVPATNVHAPSIAAVAEAGITTGISDDLFGPGLAVTRAQMATFLVRTSPDLEPSSTPPPFADVEPGNIHAPFIAAVAEAEIAGGFSDGTYGPNREVTRGQMATFLARTFLWEGPTPPTT